MADDLKKSLKSYSKNELIRRYDMTEYYGKNLTDVKKIPKIEIMEDIYGAGLLKDGDKFSSGGLVTKNYVNPVTIVDNLKNKK